MSNIRPQGLGYEAAARRIDWIAAAGVARGVTGVGLKDESGGGMHKAITGRASGPAA